MGIFSSAERLKCKFVATLNLKKHLPIHHRAPRRDKAEAANADVANGEEERNANGGGNEGDHLFSVRRRLCEKFLRKFLAPPIPEAESFRLGFLNRMGYSGLIHPHIAIVFHKIR